MQFTATMTEDEFASAVTALATRVQVLEDIEHIKAVHRTFVRCLADRQWDVMLGLCTDDVVFDLGHDGIRRGRDQVADLFTLIDSRGNPHAGYVLSSPVIEVAADQAGGVWTLHRHQCDFPSMGGTLRVYGPWSEGRYHCEYRHTHDGWRFSRVHVRDVLPDRQPEPDTHTPLN